MDKNHRARKIFRHEIGNFQNNDELIFEEKSDAFTVGIALSSDEKYYFISTSDHNTSEQYFFKVDEKKPQPKLIKKRKKGILYSVSSWDNKFYNHTNEGAEDFKIEISESLENQKWKSFIKPKNEVLIGSCIFLKNWIIRSETSNALDRLFVRHISKESEEELNISDEKVCVPNISLRQKDRDTDVVYIGYSSPKTPSRVYLYDLSKKTKKLVKEQIIPSGHNPDNYVVERVEFESHDGRLVPLTITRHKKTKLDGSANLLLYGYGSYGISMSPSFSSTKLSLIDSLSKTVDKVILGGGIANTCLAAKGYEVGKSLIEDSMLEEAKELVANPKIIIPES